MLFLCGCQKTDLPEETATATAVIAVTGETKADWYLQQAISNMETYQSTIVELRELINGYRMENGLTALQEDTILGLIASYRAVENADNDWMETYQDEQGTHHLRPDKSSVTELYRKFEKYGNYGEILGRRQQNAEDVFHDWKLSDEHNLCMLESRFAYFGIGVAQAENGDFYYVIEFLDENVQE